jgi:hypothetical protein
VDQGAERHVLDPVRGAAERESGDGERERARQGGAEQAGALEGDRDERATGEAPGRHAPGERDRAGDHPDRPAGEQDAVARGSGVQHVDGEEQLGRHGDREEQQRGDGRRERHGQDAIAGDGAHAVERAAAIARGPHDCARARVAARPQRQRGGGDERERGRVDEQGGAAETGAGERAAQQRSGGHAGVARGLDVPVGGGQALAASGRRDQRELGRGGDRGAARDRRRRAARRRPRGLRAGGRRGPRRARRARGPERDDRSEQRREERGDGGARPRLLVDPQSQRHHGEQIAQRRDPHRADQQGQIAIACARHGRRVWTAPARPPLAQRKSSE